MCVKNVFFVGLNDSIFLSPLLFCRLRSLTELFGFSYIFIALCCWRCVRVFYLFLPCIFIIIALFYRFSLVLSFQPRFFVLASFYLNLCTNFFLFLFHLESFVRGVVANYPLIDFTSTKQTDWRLCRITMDTIISHTPQYANQTEKGHVHAKLNRHVNR